MDFFNLLCMYLKDIYIMNMDNMMKIFLLIILSIGVGESLTPIARFAHSSVLVDKIIYFFGGSITGSGSLDQILYLDVSKPFDTTNPPFEGSPVSMPFGSNFATALLSLQKNIIYLFGGIMVDVNTDNDKFISMLHSYNLETNVWDIPKTNGIEPERRREINGVINYETGKFYIFGGGTDNYTGFTEANYKLFNDMNIFDTVSLTWSKGSTINAPLPRVDYSATLLSNGMIVFIGGREDHGANLPFRDVDINQLSLYDTKADKWSLMTSRGVTIENRNSHTAVLTPDEKIIIFGGEKVDGPLVASQLAVLNTKTYPYEWSIPPVTATTLPPSLSFHSATLVGNYMFINFGNNSHPIQNSPQTPYFYILDIRNFTWVTQFEPEQDPTLPNAPTKIATSSTSSPTNLSNINAEESDNSKKIGTIVGVFSASLVVSAIAGFLGFKFYKNYKKRQYNHAIPTAGTNHY